MLYSCTRMATVGVKGLRWTDERTDRCLAILTLNTAAGTVHLQSRKSSPRVTVKLVINSSIELTAVGIGLKELKELPKCLKLCPGIEI